MQCFVKGSTEELSLFYSSLFPVFYYMDANSSFLRGQAGSVTVFVSVHAFGTPVGVSQGVLVLCSVCFFRYMSARGNVCLRSFACLCLCVCVCVVFVDVSVCLCIHTKERREEGWSMFLLYKRNRVTWRQSTELVCVCLRICVCVCVCQPVPAQYPGIQPAPGTVVHPTRRTVALFISETHSLCVCVCLPEEAQQCVNVACIYRCMCKLNVSL